MLTDTMEDIEEDINENDLLHDVYDDNEQSFESTRLSEMVNRIEIFFFLY